MCEAFIERFSLHGWIWLTKYTFILNCTTNKCKLSTSNGDRRLILISENTDSSCMGIQYREGSLWHYKINMYKIIY